MQAPLHATSPGAQTHWPEEQTRVASQAWPQLPQFWLFAQMSLHVAPSQSPKCGSVQVQWPPWQLWAPAAQTLEQLPQWV